MLNEDLEYLILFVNCTVRCESELSEDVTSFKPDMSHQLFGDRYVHPIFDSWSLVENADYVTLPDFYLLHKLIMVLWGLLIMV